MKRNEPFYSLVPQYNKDGKFIGIEYIPTDGNSFLLDPDIFDIDYLLGIINTSIKEEEKERSIKTTRYKGEVL